MNRLFTVRFLPEDPKKSLPNLIRNDSPFDGHNPDDRDPLFEKMFRKMEKNIDDKQTYHLINKYLYYSNSSALAYLHALSLMKNDAEKKAIFDVFSELKDVSDFVYVSLGSGDGHKDLSIINHLKAQYNFSPFYAPIDSSPHLLHLALGLFAFGDEKDNAFDIHKILPFNCDFFKMTAADINTPEEINGLTKIFFCLGGTLGNYHEIGSPKGNTNKGLLIKAKELMSDSDYLIIGVELFNSETERVMLPRYTSQASAKFLLSPLRTIPLYRGYVEDSPSVFCFDPDSLRFSVRPELTDVSPALPNTSIKTRTFAPLFQISGKNTVLCAAWSTKYNKGELINLVKNAGFEIVVEKSETDANGSWLVLCLKKHPKQILTVIPVNLIEDLAKLQKSTRLISITKINLAKAVNRLRNNAMVNSNALILVSKILDRYSTKQDIFDDDLTNLLSNLE